jgi:hypothetical protein
MAGKSLERDLQPLSVRLKTSNAEIVGELKAFTQQYVHPPTNTNETRKNLALIQELLPSLQAHFGANVNIMRTAEASINNTCKITPMLRGKYSNLGGFYHDLATITEERKQAYVGWLISLRNENQAIDRADGSANANWEAAEKAFAQVESKEREFASLVRQALGQK